MTRTLLIFTSLSVGACMGSPANPPSEPADVTFVEEYGECGHGCYRELGVAVDGAAHVVVRDRRGLDVVLDRTVQLDADEAARVRELAAQTVAQPWAERYGCPDCVDQGVFSLEVRGEDITQHTMLDPLDHPASFDPLVEVLRDVLAREIAN